MTHRIRLALAFACLLLSILPGPIAAAEPKQVMLLYSFGKDFKPWSAYATAIRTELNRQTASPLDITEYSLVTARSGDDDAEAPFVDYLRAVHAKRPLDLIIAIGAPAADFVQRYRPKLFADTPMLLMAVDQRRVEYSRLGANDAVVAVNIDYLTAVENILRVLPNTQNVTVVVGTSPIEKFWKEEIRKGLAPLSNRIKFSWTDELPFADFLKQAAHLPPNSAIFWELMIVDAAGVVHEGAAPLTQLHAVANAPIFSYDESFFGQEIVGGPLLLVADSSRQAAGVAVRILDGAKPAEIKASAVGFASPIFDWRELHRWGISESVLPPGSQVLFREPTMWSQYRWQLIFIAAVIFTEALLIVGLLYERNRRRVAEVLSLRRLSELAHLNRVATAGELSASIAHEIRQPLTAMAANIKAALNWLGQTTPDVEETRTSLYRIKAATERTNAIVENLRLMFRKESGAHRVLDINQLIRSVLNLVSHDIQKHDISVRFVPAERAAVMAAGDQAQLEQVFLNLFMNAIEAMSGVPDAPRILDVKTDFDEPAGILITVSDSGPGLDPADIENIFNSFHTTKPDGMGMGLSICRSIIEAHGGRISATPGKRGLIFQVRLPAAQQAAR